MKRSLYALLGFSLLALTGFAVQWFDETINRNVKTSVSDPLPVHVVSDATLVGTPVTCTSPSCTVDPDGRMVLITCDGGACAVTLDETSAYDGLEVCLVCANDTDDGTETCDLLDDTPTVANYNGDAMLDNDDMLCVTYVTDHYVEEGRSNN